MWLPIDDTYCISIDGQVKKNGRLMKGAEDTKGYRQVSHHGRVMLVHRLVAARFLPMPPGDGVHHVDHIDRNPKNNHASNLRWCDRSTNMLNRDHRKSSDTGEQYITLYPFPNGTFRFVFRFQRASRRHQQYFNTLDEAITFRDNFIAAL